MKKTAMKGLISDLECDVHFWKQHCEKRDVRIAKLQAIIRDTADSFAPDPVPHDLGVFIEAIEAIIK